MQRQFDNSRREVVELLQRKRRHGRSLTDNELRELLKVGNFEKETGMSSEALLSTSACPGASLSSEEGDGIAYPKMGDCENERT